MEVLQVWNGGVTSFGTGVCYQLWTRVVTSFGMGVLPVLESVLPVLEWGWYQFWNGVWGVTSFGWGRYQF